MMIFSWKLWNLAGFTTGFEKSFFLNNFCAWCSKIKFYLQTCPKGFCCFIYAILCYMHPYGTIYTFNFTAKKKFQNLKIWLDSQRDLNLKKISEKGGGYVINETYPPIRFRRLRGLTKIQVYRILGICLKFFQKFFCCLKKIIYTHSCTRLSPCGNLA